MGGSKFDYAVRFGIGAGLMVGAGALIAAGTKIDPKPSPGRIALDELVEPALIGAGAFLAIGAFGIGAWNSCTAGDAAILLGAISGVAVPAAGFGSYSAYRQLIDN